MSIYTCPPENFEQQDIYGNIRTYNDTSFCTSKIRGTCYVIKNRVYCYCNTIYKGKHCENTEYQGLGRTLTHVAPDETPRVHLFFLLTVIYVTILVLAIIGLVCKRSRAESTDTFKPLRTSSSVNSSPMSQFSNLSSQSVGKYANRNKVSKVRQRAFTSPNLTSSVNGHVSTPRMTPKMHGYRKVMIVHDTPLKKRQLSLRTNLPRGRVYRTGSIKSRRHCQPLPLSAANSILHYCTDNILKPIISRRSRHHRPHAVPESLV